MDAEISERMQNLLHFYIDFKLMQKFKIDAKTNLDDAKHPNRAKSFKVMQKIIK